MSISSLPEWKQLLLEKKRREEEERGRREKEEEEKLASMPAWKRGIIQRRKAKQETSGDREKEREMCLLQVDIRSNSDGLSDTDSSVTINLGSELSISPDPGQWLDADPKPQSQVSVETIVPLHENPFIRTQSAWRKGKDVDVGSDAQVNEREKEKPSSRGQDVESGIGRDIELKIERFRDLSEGREKDRSRDRSQGRERENSKEIWEKDTNQWKESGKDSAKEREIQRVTKDEEEKETDPPSVSFTPIVPCLQTIRADNIIIIEQDRKGSDERRSRWKEVEREGPEEDHQGKRGMKMDLREILAGGGSVTEIRASEVLIIKPPLSPEERNTGAKGREDGEIKCIMDARRESMGRELRKDMFWLREKEKETVKDKERPWGQATVIKEDRKDSLDDNVFVEKGGRVSQLLSKFGEHPKPPSRSKSSDNFLQTGGRKYSGDQDDQQSEERKADGRNLLMKGVPKRSFSFSDRVISAEENGLDDEGNYERKTRQRIHSDKSVALWGNVEGLGNVRLGCTESLDKDRFGKHRDVYGKNKEEKVVNVQRRNEADKYISIQHRGEGKEVEPVNKRALEKPGDAGGDEGFTVASVKNTERISFARRVPIRQDGKVRAEREVKRLTGEKTLERELSIEKDSEAGQTEAKFCTKVPDFYQEDRIERVIPAEAMQNFITATSADTVSPCHTAESENKHESAFTECSGLLCTVTDRARGSRGPCPTHSVLSQHTEELISKIEKIGDTTVYSNEKGQRVYRGAYEITPECKEEGPYSDVSSDSLSHDLTARSPRRITPMGIPPLEIQIPRTVFYVAEEVVERKKAPYESTEGQNWEGGQGVERRDSWRVGKPLSRIESLQEKIRHRELERRKQRQTQDGDGREVEEISDTAVPAAAGDRYDEGGTEIENEWEAVTHMRKKLVEPERAQEDTLAQTSTAEFDVTQEVSVLKTCPQLPVAVPHLQAVIGEEVTSGSAAAASEIISGSFQISEDENDSLKHAEEELKFHRDRHESREEEREEENKELSEEEVKEFTLPADLSKSLSPSQPHPNSLTAMSRIYNLEAVGSRSGLCLRQRNVDISTVHLTNVKPLISNAQQGDSNAFTGDNFCGVQAIQRQIEQIHLKEHEALKSCSSPNTSLKDRETKGQQSPRGVLKQQVKDDVKTQEKDQETTESNSKMSPKRICSPTSQLKQTVTITSLHLRSQPQDNSLKSTDCAPTPASSPCSPSPAPSPSVSPSPTPSPVPFSIRSASGGQVKRGATITITPKRPAAANGAKAGTTTGSKSAGSTPPKAPSPSQQTQAAPTTPTTPTAADPAKKRYPTVEEIEVVGGYQNLEKSCLVKDRVNPKKVKVCFDEEQLEQVCEYPSETSMLACYPYPHDLGKMESLQGEEAQEEEDEVEATAVVSKSTRNVGMASRGLRVSQCHPLLKKHSV